MKLLSANILHSQLAPKQPWNQRSQTCCQLLVDDHPDIIFLQECATDQYQTILPILGPSYKVVHDHTVEATPLNTIFVNISTMRIMDTFYLPLPNCSKFIQKPNRLRRYLNGVQIQCQQTNKHIYCFNTHLTYGDTALAMQQIQAITDYIEQHTPQNACTILGGDFNHEYDSNLLQHCRVHGFEDTYTLCHQQPYSGPTFHMFKSDFKRHTQIDWLLIKNHSHTVTNANIMNHIPAESYGSDHFFITAELAL